MGMSYIIAKKKKKKPQTKEQNPKKQTKLVKLVPHNV